MKTKKAFLIFTFAAVITINGCCPTLQNLETVKNEVANYYESGRYDSELKEIISDIKPEFESINVGLKSAVVFDVDETTLSNYKVTKELDFGYVKHLWEEWILKEEADAIIPVRDFYNYLVDRGFKIIFITGRKDYQHQATFNNLIKAGYTKFDTLITRNADEYKLSAVEYKSAKRTELTSKGYDIKGNFGDQWSDLEGVYSGIKVKLPNYQYGVD
jgi:acid phosphatase